MNYKNAQVRLTIKLEGALGSLVSSAKSDGPMEFAKLDCKQCMVLGSEFIDYATSEESRIRKFDVHTWKNMKKIKRLEAHLDSIAESLNGKVLDYKVIE